MAELIISVRSVEEALIAARNGADVVDVKEPMAGPMGRADRSVLRAVLKASLNVRLGMASGELSDPLLDVVDWSALKGFCFAKAAPAGCYDAEAWNMAWKRWSAQRLARVACVKRVAVVYADHRRAGSLAPRELVTCASASDASGILFDTYEKDGATLFDHVDAMDVGEMVESLHACGKWVGLAGSLSLADIAIAADCGADLIAFRGAACHDSRVGKLLPGKILDLKNEIMKRFNTQEVRSNFAR